MTGKSKYFFSLLIWQCSILDLGESVSQKSYKALKLDVENQYVND